MHSDNISDLAELLLYLAARNELVEKIILPEMKRRQVIVLDRFVDSTIAYQGYGRKIPLELIETVHQHILKGIKPDITFLIDESPCKLKKEIKMKHPDRLEKSINFQKKVRKGYIEIARMEPERIRVIKRGSIDKTFSYIKKIWQEFMNESRTNL